MEKEPARTSCIYRKWDLTDSAVTPEAYYLQRRTRMALRECLEMNWFDQTAGGRA